MTASFDIPARHMPKPSVSYESELIICLVYLVLTGVDELDDYQMVALPTNHMMGLIWREFAMDPTLASMSDKILLLDRFCRKMTVPKRSGPDRAKVQNP